MARSRMGHPVRTKLTNDLLIFTPHQVSLMSPMQVTVVKLQTAGNTSTHLLFLLK